MSEPRKHHIIPAFYLAGFTATGLKNAPLQIMDFRRQHRYTSTPLGAYRQTDFYRAEEPGYDPNEIEKRLGQIESAVATAAQLAGTGHVPTADEVRNLITLACLMWVRSRGGRRAIQRAARAGLAQRIREGAFTSEQWERVRQSELRNGARAEDVPALDEAAAKLASREWYPQAPQVITVGVIPELTARLTEQLLKRDWSLHVTDPAVSGGFITSDHPLAWGHLEAVLAGEVASLADPTCEITFPVNRRAALVSYPKAPRATMKATVEIVARLNSRTLLMSEGNAICADDGFRIMQPDGGPIWRGNELFANVERRSANGLFLPPSLVLPTVDIGRLDLGGRAKKGRPA